MPYERTIDIEIVEGVGNHHMHRYTRKGGKQPESAFHEGPTTEAIPAAIDHLKAHWEAIIESCRS